MKKILVTIFFMLLILSSVFATVICGSVPGGGNNSSSDENEFGRAEGNWLDDSSFKLSIEIAEAYQNHPEIDPALMDIKNETEIYEIGLSKIGFNVLVLGGKFYNLTDVGVSYSYDPYKKAELVIPSQWNNNTLIAEGDNINIKLLWTSHDPVFFIQVPAYNPPAPAPPPKPQPKVSRPPVAVLRVTSAKWDERGKVLITLKNVGNSGCVGNLKIKSGLSYDKNWISEWCTDFYSNTLDSIKIAPGKSVILKLEIPEVPRDIFQKFHERLKNVWSGYNDSDPLDYICITITIVSKTKTLKTWTYVPLVHTPK